MEQLYREILLDLYRHPQNKGEISNCDIEVYDLNPLCGDEIRLQLKLAKSKTSTLRSKATAEDGQNAKDKIIEEAVFSGNGCVISQASAEVLTEYIKGKSLEELKNLNSRDLLGMLEINPPPGRLGCALLSLGVLKKGLVRN